MPTVVGCGPVYSNWQMSSCNMSIGECPVGECLIGVYGYTLFGVFVLLFNGNVQIPTIGFLFTAGIYSFVMQ